MRLMIMADNIEVKTPKPKTKAKPLIKDVPNQKRMMAVMILEVLESRMENQAREKPFLIDSFMLFPSFISSFKRSKINTLASTAKPIEIIKPAIEAAVKVTGINLNKASMIDT